MQLGQLAALERDEILKEFNQLRGQIRTYEELLADDKKILDIIRTDLIEMRDKYSNEQTDRDRRRRARSADARGHGRR